ncbi:hypothetical protein KIPB_013088, partial [Kipferlia bialata]
AEPGALPSDPLDTATPDVNLGAPPLAGSGHHSVSAVADIPSGQPPAPPITDAPSPPVQTILPEGYSMLPDRELQKLRGFEKLYHMYSTVNKELETQLAESQGQGPREGGALYVTPASVPKNPKTPKEWKAVIKHLQAQLKEAGKASATFDKEVNKYKKGIAVRDSTIQRLKDDVDALANEKRELEEDLKRHQRDCRNNVEARDKEIKRLGAALARAQREVDHSKGTCQRVRDLENDLHKALTENDSLLGDVSHLKHSLAQWQETYQVETQRLGSIIHETTQERDGLMQTVEQMGRDLSQCQEDKQALQVSLSQEQARHQQCQDQSQQLMREKAEVERERDNTCRDLNTARGHHQTEVYRHRKTCDTLSETQAHLEAMTKREEETDANWQQLQVMYKKRVDWIAELEAKLSTRTKGLYEIDGVNPTSVQNAFAAQGLCGKV